MANLVGIFAPAADRAEVTRALARMRQALEAAGAALRAEVTVADGIGCAVVGGHAGAVAPCIRRDEGRRIWLAFAGELYGREELLGRGGADALPDEGDAGLCLRLLLSEGEDFVRRLNGHFNIVVGREAEGRLSIATDPFGYRPLFLAARGRRLLFASEMKAIVAALDAAPAVDGIGLLEFFRHGWSLGERTWLEPIRLADAGTWYHVDPEGTRSRRYFRFGYRRRQGSSLSAYAEEFAARLRPAVRRAAADAGRVGLALSGGLDSRALLLAAEGEVRGAYTFGGGDSRDVTSAVELARLAGVPHLHLPYEPGYLGRCLSPVVWRTDGLLPFSEATLTSMHFHDRLAERFDLLLYGHAGDALTGAHLAHRTLLSRSRGELIDRAFRGYNRVPEALLKRVFNPSFHRRFAPDLLESWRATFAGIEQEHLADVVDVWDMENRQRRGTFPSAAADRGRFGVRAPFLDRDLVDHLSQAPPRWRLQQLAYKRMITTSFPAAAGVPWAYTGGRLRSRLAADFAALAGRYARRRLRGARARQRAAPVESFRDLAADTRADRRVAAALRDFARDPSFPEEILDRDGVEEVVRRHWQAGEDLTHLVSVLATFATAHRLFVATPRMARPTP